jgi:hypothetical protein
MRGVPKLDVHEGWKMFLDEKGPFKGYQSPWPGYGADVYWDVYEQVNSDFIDLAMWEHGNWKKDSRE